MRQTRQRKYSPVAHAFLAVVVIFAYCGTSHVGLGAEQDKPGKTAQSAKTQSEKAHPEKSKSTKSQPAKLQPARQKQYKKTNLQLMARIIDGQPEAAIEGFGKLLEADPNDLEAIYGLAVAHAQLGDLPRAVEFMDRAIHLGMPIERFLAGPRRLLQPLTETDAFQKTLAEHDVRLIHGPMLGCVTDRSAKFWLRTQEEVSVQVLASTSEDMTRPLRSATVFTDARHDYTTVAELVRLEPDTKYYYEVLLDGQPTLEPARDALPAFRTFPSADRPARFQIGFGGGAGYTPWKERMWDTITSHELLAFLCLGDNVYIDMPDKPEAQQYCYYRRQSRPEFRRLTGSTSIFSIWDDHDFCVNDGRGGPERAVPEWKIPVWELFQDNWNNPGYGGGEKHPGCWYRFSMADVDFFMLDGRYWRTDPRKENPSMLGPAQKKWLFDELKRSRATFKVLASPVPWVLEAKGNSPDTWRGYQAEREEIFSFIEKNRVDGVLLLSADRHRSDVWRIERENGYPLYEFESSRLTNVHVHGVMPGALFGYNEKCSFGKLTFDTTKPDPEATYQIVNIDNKLIHTFTVRKSDISSP